MYEVSAFLYFYLHTIHIVFHFNGWLEKQSGEMEVR